MARGSRRDMLIHDEYVGDDIKKELKDATEYYPAEVEKTGPETTNGIISNALYVKARTDPSFDAEVVELLRKGDRVQIIEVVDRFHKVNTGLSKEVYVASEFIKEE